MKQTAIVTGGSRGIGRAVAVRLAKDGMNLVINYRGNSAAAEETERLCRELGAEVLLVQGDVSRAEDCEKLAAQAKEAFGRVDVLVNNAGITRDGLLARMTEEDFRAVLDVNLVGPWNMMKAVNRIMMKQRYGRSYVTEPDLKEYAVRFGPGFTPDLLRDIPTMDDIDQLSCASDVLTAFCGMSYGTKPETDEWRAAVCRLSRLMNWTTPERFMLVNEIRREQPNMEKPIFSFMGVPITEDSAGKLAEAMKKSGVSALEVVTACETLKKISKALLDELPGVTEEEHND